jgi:hypothetical protein
MAFDINEARKIIEDAKQRGQIQDANAKPVPKPKAPLKPSAESTVIPDWLQQSIDAGPSDPGDSGNSESLFR